MSFLIKFFIAVFALCSVAQADTLDKILKKKTLVVGMEPGFMPFEMQTAKGDYVGFDVSMMRAFAKHLGVEVKFVSTKWDGIIPGLMARKYDLIVSGMTITPERSKVVLFSEPYYKAGLKVLIKPELAKEVRSLKDLDQKKYTIAVKLGTTGDLFASKTIKNAKIRKLDTEADAAQSVLLKKVDGFIYDKPYLELYSAKKGQKVALLPDNVSDESFGVAARRKDRRLIGEFNTFLGKWKADKTNGYDKVYNDIFVKMTWKKEFPKSVLI